MKPFARSVLLALALSAAGCGAHPLGAKPTAAPAPTLAVVDAGPEAQGLLEAGARLAVEQGAGPLLVVARAVLAEGDRAGAFLSLPKERCVLVHAHGSPGIADLDLFAFVDDGGSIASDESTAASAAILLCPPLPARVFVSTRVASGAGVVAIGAHEVEPAQAERAGRAVSARARGEDSGRLESWPGLETRIRQHRTALGSSWEDVRRFAAPVDPRAPTRSTVIVEAKRCIDVLVLPSDEAGSLEVLAESDDGRVIARAGNQGRERSMLLCSEHGELVTIVARPRGAAGLAAFVVGRSPVGAIAELERQQRVDRLSQSLALAEAQKQHAEALDPAWGTAQSAGSGQARVGSRTALALQHPEGCSRVDVVAGAPLGPLVAALWELDGRLVHEEQGALGATLFVCGAARELRLEAEARARPGPFAVLRRGLGALRGDAATRPLAAARLLARVAAAGDERPLDLGSARALSLQPGERTSIPVAAPARGCVEIVAALEGPARWLELSLVDEQGGDGLRARGAHTASQRLCGQGGPRTARLELSVDAGPAEVLVSVRALPPPTTLTLRPPGAPPAR